MRNEIAIVESNKQISSIYYKLQLLSPEISQNCQPGQFINILPQYNWPQVMRRPMSIAGQTEDSISVIYKVVGEGTSIIQSLTPNSKLDIIGPLGNYWTDFDSGYPILIAGGVGIGPILFLHNHLKEKDIDHHLIMGTRTEDEQFLLSLVNNDLTLTTEDGSFGLKGTVMNALMKLNHDLLSNAKFFCCGPQKMLDGVNLFSIDRGLTCYLALETIMACGIGICQGCAIEVNKKLGLESRTYRKKYVLACADGPIFNGKDLARC